MYVSMYVFMYVCMSVSMYVCMYVRMYVFMYVCMSVSMYVCMYVKVFSLLKFPAQSFLQKIPRRGCFQWKRILKTHSIICVFKLQYNRIIESEKQLTK